ncbi:MAG TPA: hypothetical protein VGM88_06210 [Kofleriaceae bacterium]|jgi:hypothetical protein
MAILNITYKGIAADYTLSVDASVTDDDLRRIAAEVVRAGDVRGLVVPELAPSAFSGYVVDRLKGPDGEERYYIRPAVPFGCA